MVRLFLAVTAAALLARCLWAPLLPALICLVGLRQGGERGAFCGLLGGVLALCLGFSPWILPFLTLLGGISGAVFHNPSGFWGNWLRALPLVAGYCLLPALGHWLTGEALIPCLILAGRDFLRTALTLPFVSPFCPKRRSQMSNFRFFTAAGLFTGLLVCFGVLLWDLQVVSGAAYYERSQQSTAQVETVPAARGKLLDRKGKILAQDSLSWTVQVPEDCEGAALHRLTILCREEGVDWSGAGDITQPSPSLLVRLRGENLPDITILPVVTRASGGDLAPHVIGRVGAMTPDQWETYGAQGYPMDALVGQDGAEAAFEGLLHGIDGEKVIQTDRQGQVTGEDYALLPQPGQDVTLTLDKDLQGVTQQALGKFLATHDCPGGAAVVLDVSDGGVLAMASLPGYDTAAFSTDYTALSGDETAPLMNRAIQGLYAPGSTFKLVTAAAALEEGVLTPETRILDTGRYTYYPSPQPQCWIYRQEGRTHGLETLSEAIADSCNIYFYDAGRRVGIETLDTWAHALGLGEATGIELAGEGTGVVAGPAYTKSVGGAWYEGSVLSAAIGQENNRFTPLQLAHMTATLVGGGERWQVHLLKKAGEEAYIPVSLGKVELSPENLAAIKEGMLAVTQSGSLANAFRDLPVQVGAKTGSAQVAGAEEANAVLVAFAPYEDPQLALALVAEEGGSGSGLGEVASAILEEYFG